MFQSLFFAAVTHSTLLVFALSLGGLVRLHNPKSITNRFFFWFAMSIVMYNIANFGTIFFSRPGYLNFDYTLISVKFVMVFASLLTVFMALFVYVFPKEEVIFSPIQKISLSIESIIYVVSGFFVWKDFDFTKPLQIGTMTPQTIPNLPILPIWGLVTILITFTSVGYLIVKYKKFESEDKKNYLSTVIGLSTFAILPILLFLPVALWNDSRIDFYGPLAYVAIIYGVGYGIIRHHIFNVKLLYAEVCVLVMAFILFINIFTP